MKVKKIEIRFQTANESMDLFGNSLAELERGKALKVRNIVAFDNVNEFRKFLTPNRIKMLRFIKKERPSSIYELAAGLKRGRRHVTEDLTILRNLGFVELRKEKNVRDMVKPVVNFDRIDIEIVM